MSGKNLPRRAIVSAVEASMGLSSSIYIGTTGVIAHQENMSVISDNIANMNTLGFKSSRMLFDTLLSEQLTGASVGNQIGQGVGVSSIYRDMSVGAFETTTASTDIAISGTGFFLVSPDNSDATYYTRAGNFRFDEAGYLRDPQGNILQGYSLPVQSILDTDPVIPAASAATLQDIQLETQADGSIVSQPEATTEMRMMINLDSDSLDSTTNAASPFTALFDSWDATLAEPLGDAAYAYASSLKIYDQLGQSHEVTAYFDPATEMTDSTYGNKVWEYLITIPTAEDASALATKKGVLMAGTVTFAPGGELLNMTAFSGTSDDKSTWVPVGLSEAGYPILTATLAGTEPIVSSLDMGLSTASGWSLPAGVASMADLGTTYAGLPSMLDATPQALALTNYDSGSSTIFQAQNGYPQGFLQSVSVDTAGTLIGNYSNGQSQALYKIPLADFINPQGLFREGGNLFSASRDSGAVMLGWASEGRLGKIASNSLENSNVDLASEFVNMILTQKGFDANSKSITTADQVVQTAIQMKK
jgi:flagellar hook protein FlgE